MRGYEQIIKKIKVSELKDVKCNKCGKEHKVKDGYDLDLELFHNIYLTFGYGSSYDTESWSFDLCEGCLVKFVDTFKIKPDGKDVD